MLASIKKYNETLGSEIGQVNTYKEETMGLHWVFLEDLRRGFKITFVTNHPHALYQVNKVSANYECKVVKYISDDVDLAMQYCRNRGVGFMLFDMDHLSSRAVQFINSLERLPGILFTGHREDLNPDKSQVDRYRQIANALGKLLPYRGPKVKPKEETEAEKDPILYVRAGRKMVRIEVDKLTYVEGMKDYVKLHFVDRKMVVVKRTMKSMEDQLKQYDVIRVHRSFLVAQKSIKQIIDNEIQLNDCSIPIGRNYRQFVKHILDESVNG
ncbi:MAG: LytTR family transcriptional regulator [Bacteroidia bacterium]|nr:LytTR family transcriptional regulator [Bacteroidia bacterium]